MLAQPDGSRLPAGPGWTYEYKLVSVQGFSCDRARHPVQPGNQRAGGRYVEARPGRHADKTIQNAFRQLNINQWVSNEFLTPVSAAC